MLRGETVRQGEKRKLAQSRRRFLVSYRIKTSHRVTQIYLASLHPGYALPSRFAPRDDTEARQCDAKPPALVAGRTTNTPALRQFVIAKIFCFSPDPNQMHIPRRPGPLEGRFAIVTDVGHGMRWTRGRQARMAIAGRDEPRERSASAPG